MGKTRIDEAALRRTIRDAPGMRAVLQDQLDEMADKVREQGIRVGDRDGGPDEIDLPVETVIEAGAGGLVGKVILAHPAGQAVQAKHGSLTEAATRAGLRLSGGGS